MVEYTVEQVLYPETGDTKMVLQIQEGEYEGAAVRIDHFEMESDDMMSVEYTLLDGPEGLSETDEGFVEEFKSIMLNLVEMAIKEANDKSQR